MPSRSTTTRSATPLDLVQPVRDEDDADAVGLERRDDVEQLVGLGERQARGRLVEDDQPRLDRQRLGDLDHLLLGQRQAGDRRVGARNWRRARLSSGATIVRSLSRSTSLSGPARSGSRPKKMLAATSRLSNRLSSWWTKAMPAPMLAVDGEPVMRDAVDGDRAAVRAR